MHARDSGPGRICQTILNEARMLDMAKDEYALQFETKCPSPNFADLTPFLKRDIKLATNGGRDSLGNPFVIGGIADRLRVSPVTQSNLLTFTGGTTFWGPYS